MVDDIELLVAVITDELVLDLIEEGEIVEVYILEDYYWIRLIDVLDVEIAMGRCGHQ